ncbi:hypothetical protein EP331_08450, partial [bacterium]
MSIAIIKKWLGIGTSKNEANAAGPISIAPVSSKQFKEILTAIVGPVKDAVPVKAEYNVRQGLIQQHGLEVAISYDKSILGKGKSAQKELIDTGWKPAVTTEKVTTKEKNDVVLVPEQKVQTQAKKAAKKEIATTTTPFNKNESADLKSANKTQSVAKNDSFFAHKTQVPANNVGNNEQIVIGISQKSINKKTESKVEVQNSVVEQTTVINQPKPVIPTHPKEIIRETEKGLTSTDKTSDAPVEKTKNGLSVADSKKSDSLVSNTKQVQTSVGESNVPSKQTLANTSVANTKAEAKSASAANQTLGKAAQSKSADVSGTKQTNGARLEP